MSATNAQGSARVSRVGFGVAPKQSFPGASHPFVIVYTTKVRDGENAIASTRDACATQYARDR